MDQELFESLSECVDACRDLRVLSEQEAKSIQLLVEETFRIPAGSAWPWANLGVPYTVHFYGDENPFEAILKSIGGAQRVCVAVTDDEPPPWTTIEGSAESIIGMIGEQRFFEYFIVASAPVVPKWAIFDNHHNQLVLVGDLKVLWMTENE